MPGGLRSLLLRPSPPPQPRGSVPPSRRASAAGRPSARAGAPLRLPRARGAEYRPGPVRSDVRSLPPPPARSPWPAGRPRTATATGRSSSGTRRRRSCWAVPGAAGVSAGPGAAGTAARGATPPSPAAGLRRGRGLRAYRGGAGVQVGRAGAGRGGPTLARAPRPWGAFPGIAAAGGRPPGCAPFLPLYACPEEGRRAASALRRVTTAVPSRAREAAAAPRGDARPPGASVGGAPHERTALTARRVLPPAVRAPRGCRSLATAAGGVRLGSAPRALPAARPRCPPGARARFGVAPLGRCPGARGRADLLRTAFSYCVVCSGPEPCDL